MSAWKEFVMLQKILLFVEIVLFCFSLFLLVPPVPSDIPHYYEFFPLGWLSVLLFSMNRALALKRRAELPVVAFFQIIVYLCFGLLVCDRLQVK